MVVSNLKQMDGQIHMPGIPTMKATELVTRSSGIIPGQVVQYLGRVSGGPEFGAEGTVLKTLRIKAIVDLGCSGRWHIPYFFLALLKPRKVIVIETPANNDIRGQDITTAIHWEN